MNFNGGTSTPSTADIVLIEADVSTLEQKTQYQTAVTGTGTTNFSDSGITLSSIYNPTKVTSINLSQNSISVDAPTFGTQDIKPSQNGAYDIGSGALRYDTVYCNTIDAPSIINVLDPISDQDVATKAYVDTGDVIKPITGYTALTTGAKVICSVRKVNAAYNGPCCTIRRSSDSAEQDIYFDNFSLLDNTSFTAFVGGGTGYIKTIYDQSGNGNDYEQLETAKQPTLVWNVDIPEIQFNNGDQDRHFNSKNTTGTMGLNLGTYTFTTQFRSNVAEALFIFGSDEIARYEVHLGVASTNIRTYPGSVNDFTVSNWADNNYHTFSYLVGNGEVNIRYDGDFNTPQIALFTSPDIKLNWGIRLDSFNEFQGYSNELIVWNTIPSGDTLAGIETDQIALWPNSTKATTPIDDYHFVGNSIRISKPTANYTHPNELVPKQYVDSAKDFIDLAPTTRPAAVTGRIYYDSVDNLLTYYNGTNWFNISSTEAAS